MTKKIIDQNSFTVGEVTPRLTGRTDTDEHAKGLETALNSIIETHGPIKRRNGTQFIAEVKDSSAAVKLIHYQFSQDVAYILEIGNQYIRFFTDGGQVVESALTITGITQANPGVVTSTSHGLSNGDHVYIIGVVGMTEVNSFTVPYEVANVTANTFELNDVDGANIDTTGYTAYSSGGSIYKIYEISSPWTTAQLDDIQYTQAGSFMYIAHSAVAPRQLIRNSGTDWELSTLSLSPPPTYESGYEDIGTTITPAATTGLGVNFTAGSAVFLEGDIGRQIINLSANETGRASIVSITSTTVAVCDIVEDFTNTDAIADGDWKIDLSPVVDLEFDSSQAGSIVSIRPEYTAGSVGERSTITAVTGANPGVVTTSGNHNLTTGDTVQIQDIIGMTQLNGRTFTVGTTTATTFQLFGEDTTGYTAYASGGIARRVLTGLAKDAFRAADVDKYILANGGVMQIIAVTSATEIEAEILKSMNSISNTGSWSLEVETWNATRGQPRSVGLYDQRLVFGGTIAQPQTIWFSEIGIFEGFGIGPDDEDSIEVELVSNEVNEINWMVAARDLIVGTSGGEVTVSSGVSTGISPSAIQQRPRTYHGSETQQILTIKDEVVFIQASGRKIRSLRYDFNIDSYTGEDLTFLAEHITEGGLEELAYAQEPDTLIYAVTTEGEMLVGTYDRSKRVIGWCKFETDGYYENINTISEGVEDQVWVVIRRTINGNTKRYIELFVEGDGEDDTDGFSDSFLVLSTPKTITGITVANPAVVTSTAHGFSNSDSVIIKALEDPLPADLDTSSTNMSSLNDGIYTVANVTANTFELSGVDTSGYNAYGSAGKAWERVTEISGLDHLEGKTIQVKLDGAAYFDQIVSSGAITLGRAAGEVVAGLEYTTTLKTLNIDFDIGIGSMQGQRTRWSRPLLKVYKSAKPTVNGEFLPARDTADLLGQKIPLFSGFLEYGALKWDNTSAISISLSDPLPFKLVKIVGTIEANVK